MEKKNQKKISIRLVLVLFFITQILVTIGLLGYFMNRNSQLAVNDISSQLRNEITLHIQENLKNYIEMPTVLRQLNTDAIVEGEINLNDLSGLEKHFWYQMKAFEDVGYIMFGSSDGRFYGIERKVDGSLVSVIANREKNNDLVKYSLDKNGNRLKKLIVTPNYDPKLRPWYKSAVESNKPVWTDIYAAFVKPYKLASTYVSPVYIKNELKGVLGSDILLENFSEFLRTLKIGKTGRVFIVDNQWKLVATSSNKTMVKAKGKTVERLKAFNSSDLLIGLTAKELQEKYKLISNINKKQIDLSIDGEKYFLQTVRLKDIIGLDWLIVLTIPENDFMEKIKISSKTNIYIMIILLLVALFLGTYATQRITNPLLKLSKSMSKIANFELDESRLKETQFIETQIIQDSMKQMYRDLNEYTHILNSINDLAGKLVLIREIDKLAKTTLDHSLNLVNAEKGFVAEYYHDKRNFNIVISKNTNNLKKDEILNLFDFNEFRDIVKNKEILVIDNDGYISNEKFTSLLVSPLIIKDEIKGVLFLMNKKSEDKAFKRQDKTTVQTLSNLVSSVWESIYLFDLATIDNLSKLYVRRYFDSCFAEELKRSIRYKNNLSVIMMDIDNFKHCNDTYGHLIGDKVIREVSATVKEAVREVDFAARYGGEEIIIYLPQTPVDGAFILADRIRQRISEMEIFVYHKETLSVTVSVGVSCSPENGTTVNSILYKADEALYKSKREGKNKVTIAS